MGLAVARKGIGPVALQQRVPALAAALVDVHAVAARDVVGVQRGRLLTCEARDGAEPALQLFDAAQPRHGDAHAAQRRQRGGVQRPAVGRGVASTRVAGVALVAQAGRPVSVPLSISARVRVGKQPATAPNRGGEVERLEDGAVEVQLKGLELGGVAQGQPAGVEVGARGARRGQERALAAVQQVARTRQHVDRRRVDALLAQRGIGRRDADHAAVRQPRGQRDLQVEHQSDPPHHLRVLTQGGEHVVDVKRLRRGRRDRHGSRLVELRGLDEVQPIVVGMRARVLALNPLVERWAVAGGRAPGGHLPRQRVLLGNGRGHHGPDALVAQQDARRGRGGRRRRAKGAVLGLDIAIGVGHGKGAQGVTLIVLHLEAAHQRVALEQRRPHRRFLGDSP